MESQLLFDTSNKEIEEGNKCREEKKILDYFTENEIPQRVVNKIRKE